MVQKILIKPLRCYMCKRRLLWKIMFVLILVLFYVSISKDTLDHSVARRFIEESLRNAVEEDRGTGCAMPKLNPFAEEMMVPNPRDVKCDPPNWVICKHSECKLDEHIAARYFEIDCWYEDIIYISDHKLELGSAVKIQMDQVYHLNQSDAVEVSCKGKPKDPFYSSEWKGYVGGVRRYPPRTNTESPPTQKQFNILIFCFDSAAKNGFMRMMPQSYKFLTEELGAVVLNKYNIVGDGTAQALIPILTGHSEVELPDVRKRLSNARSVDELPFIWKLLEKNGYRTGYLEDMPWIGTFTYRFTGFRKQPTDLYHRTFFMKSFVDPEAEPYCVSGLATHTIMMELTEQFMQNNSSLRFIFTFCAELTHDAFSTIGAADWEFTFWLEAIRNQGLLNDTVLIVMGDHGPRFTNDNSPIQIKQEERLPLMSIVLPDSLKATYPQAAHNLAHNAHILTTPYDLHATLLHIAGLREKAVKVKVPGASLPRSLSLLDQIPENRSCAEAGVEVHWCACLHWTPMNIDEPLCQRMADALLVYINSLTEDERDKCAVRTLDQIEWAVKVSPNERLLSYLSNKDLDGYLVRFGAQPKMVKTNYQIKIIAGPGRAVYEATLTHEWDNDTITARAEDISRTNPYNDEPNCVSHTRPELNKYCFCLSSSSSVLAKPKMSIGGDIKI